MKAIQYPLRIEGTLTRVIEAGGAYGAPLPQEDGKVEAVVLVHGLGARCDRWAGTVERMADAGYRTLTYDLPGHGLSEKTPEGPGDVPALARYLLGVLDALGIGRVVLAGTSLGGHICAYAATLAPDRIAGVMLVGALGIAPLTEAQAVGIQQSVKATSREQIRKKLMSVIADEALVTESLIEEEWRINNSPGANDYFVRMGHYLVDGIDQHYVGEKLASLYPPEKIKLVWGAEDKAVPVSIGKQCQTLLGGAELIEIAGAAHAPYFEKPEAFDPILSGFVASLERP